MRTFEIDSGAGGQVLVDGVPLKITFKHAEKGQKKTDKKVLNEIYENLTLDHYLDFCVLETVNEALEVKLSNEEREFLSKLVLAERQKRNE